MLAVLSQREKMYPEALFLYQGMASSYPRNYLLQYEVATLEGMLKDWKSAAHSYDVDVGQAPGWGSRIREYPPD